MASKQMAFQLTKTQFRKKIVELLETYKDNDNVTSVNEWVDNITQDEKERAIFRAVYVVFMKCKKEGRDIMKVKKIIGWRGSDGKPKDLEIQWER